MIYTSSGLRYLLKIWMHVPAAMVGFAHVLAALTHHRASAIMNLRSINPHLSSILSSTLPAAVPPAFPRQDAQAPQLRSSHDGWEAVQGLSSFAFQGTNAHAVLCKSLHGRPPVGTKAQQGSWRRGRFWYTAPVRSLLQWALVSNGGPALQRLEVNFATHTARSSLAHLLDHQIKGRVLLPGAAMFEMAASAAATMLAGVATSACTALLGIGLHAPFLLVPGAISLLQCSVACASGQMQVRSAQGGAQQLHATATTGDGFFRIALDALAIAHIHCQCSSA